MDIHQRLEAHAIIDRLVMNGPTFAADDARRLIDLVPVAPSSRISFKGSFRGRGPGFKGHAAGVGDVEMKGEAKEKTLTLNVPTSHRIGGYVVTHTPGAVDIELMWGETRADQSGQSWALSQFVHADGKILRRFRFAYAASRSNCSASDG
jgi:hypothetical protein